MDVHQKGDRADTGGPYAPLSAYRRLYELTPAMMHTVDADGRIVAVSDEWLRVLGYDREEVLGRRSRDFLTTASKAYLDAVGEREFGEEHGLRDVPYTFRSKEGDPVHVLLSAVGEVDEEGRPVRTIAVLQDVTPRRRAEEVRDRFEKIMHATPDLVGIADRSGRTIYINPAGARMLGGEPDDFVGLPIEEIHPPGVASRIFATLVPTALEEGHWEGEVTLLSLDGEEIPAHMVGIVHTDADGEPEFFSTVMRDLREWKKLERHLRRSQKMQALGRLAGGVAHDFNNVLAVITGAARILREEVEDDPRLAEEVEEIELAAERATVLTRQLLASGKGQLMRPEVVDPADTVREIASFLRRLVGEAHPLEVEVEDDLPPIRVDPTQMEQVLMNLGVNARDAMPGGGRILIEVGRADADDIPEAPDDGVAPERPVWVEIAVEDRGVGMTEEVAAQMFEPFYTTKPAGEGTGLGLSTVYGIVRQSGGRIGVRSVPGEGTRLSVFLPAADASEGEREEVDREASTDAPEDTGGEARSGRILVVEDDIHVRRVLARFLRRFGHDVVETPDGREALALLEREEFDVLLTDAVMPDLTGAELIELVRGRYPDLEVILMSGYLRDDVAEGITGSFEFLQKPVSPEELRACVAGLLGEDDRHRRGA